MIVLGDAIPFAYPWLQQINRYQGASYIVSHPIVMAYHDTEVSALSTQQTFPEPVQQFIDQTIDDFEKRPPLILLMDFTHRFLSTHGILADHLWPYYVQVEEVPGEFYTYLLKPEQETTFTFGDQFTLTNWEIDVADFVTACDSVSIDTIWKTLQPTTDDYSLTVVLADSRGGVTSQDGAPAGIQTHRWTPRLRYLDDRRLEIPCDVPAGEYNLLVSLYLPDVPDSNLVVTNSDGAVIGDYLFLQTIVIE